MTPYEEPTGIVEGKTSFIRKKPVALIGSEEQSCLVPRWGSERKEWIEKKCIKEKQSSYIAVLF